MYLDNCSVVNFSRYKALPDLYNFPDKAVTDSTVDMVEKITKFNWEVETMISSHGGIIPYRQIKDEVKDFKTKK